MTKRSTILPLLLLAVLLITTGHSTSAAPSEPTTAIVSECKDNGTCVVCSFYRLYLDSGEQVYLYSTITCHN